MRAQAVDLLARRRSGRRGAATSWAIRDSSIGWPGCPRSSLRRRRSVAASSSRTAPRRASRRSATSSRRTRRSSIAAEARPLALAAADELGDRLAAPPQEQLVVALVPATPLSSTRKASGMRSRSPAARPRSRSPRSTSPWVAATAASTSPRWRRRWPPLAARADVHPHLHPAALHLPAHQLAERRLAPPRLLAHPHLEVEEAVVDRLQARRDTCGARPPPRPLHIRSCCAWSGLLTTGSLRAVVPRGRPASAPPPLPAPRRPPARRGVG